MQQFSRLHVAQEPALPELVFPNHFFLLDSQKFSVNILYLLIISRILNVGIIISFNSLISLSLPLTFNPQVFYINQKTSAGVPGFP
ncbi:MAG: hypothetical protein ACOCPN_03485 [Desulfonatronovibrionaceae bacterium]